MKSNQNAQFILKRSSDINRIFEVLCQEYPLHETDHAQLKRQFLDSFDWRMYRKGYVCGLDFDHHELLFFIQQKNNGNSLCAFPIEHIPRFPQDITHPTCHKLLDEILGIRALMTVATLTLKRDTLHLLNKDQKIITVLHAERYVLDAQTDKKQLANRLIARPVRGYPKIFKRVSNQIAAHLKLPVANSPLLDEALAVIGKKPDTDVSVLPKKLTDSQNTWEATRNLLRHLLTVMQTNEPGILEAIDTEFLHDFRVAVRRTRTMLSQIKHVFPKHRLDYFKREFSWLGTVTGPTRDLDMYLLKFDDYLKELPPHLHPELEPFRLFLQRHWKMEHTSLCRTLKSKRYQKLLDTWQQFLENKTISSSDTSAHETINAAKPAKQVASRRIWKLYKRVLKEGNAITPQSHDEALHELRKTCKKFRYLIEFFHDYYNDKSINRLIKTLKQLQENLGDFQDLCVQTDQLNHFAEQMQQEGLADTHTIMAMGVLVEKLNTRKAAIRTDFGKQFKAFTEPDKKAAFTNAFNLHNPPRGMTL